MTKLKMQIDLKRYETTKGNEAFKSVLELPLDALASCFLNAYRGTIDYEGEDIDDTKSVILESHQSDTFLKSASLAIVKNHVIISAVWIHQHDNPLIYYLVTNPIYKNQGYAERLLQHVLGILKNERHSNLSLFVTQGNLYAEKLYKKIGFITID